MKRNNVYPSITSAAFTLDPDPQMMYTRRVISILEAQGQVSSEEVIMMVRDLCWEEIEVSIVKMEVPKY